MVSEPLTVIDLDGGSRRRPDWASATEPSSSRPHSFYVRSTSRCSPGARPVAADGPRGRRAAEPVDAQPTPPAEAEYPSAVCRFGRRCFSTRMTTSGPSVAGRPDRTPRTRPGEDHASRAGSPKIPPRPGRCFSAARLPGIPRVSGTLKSQAARRLCGRRHVR
jgi:hypothetical protein